MFIPSGFKILLLRQTSVLHLKFCSQKALVVLQQCNAMSSQENVIFISGCHCANNMLRFFCVCGCCFLFLFCFFYTLPYLSLACVRIGPNVCGEDQLCTLCNH